MKIKKEFNYAGWCPTWVTPSLIIALAKFDEDASSNYKRFFELEFNWLAWHFELTIYFGKKRVNS